MTPAGMTLPSPFRPGSRFGTATIRLSTQEVAAAEREEMIAVHIANGGRLVYQHQQWRWSRYYQLHRMNGPAVECENGIREWWRDGQRHRDDGPAKVWPGSRQEWWVRGQLHRTDGPAVEYADGRVEWWRNGRQITRPDNV